MPPVHFKELGPLVGAAGSQIAEFDYVNWRGNDHHYEVDIESFQLGPFTKEGVAGPAEAEIVGAVWVLNGEVITRDGIERGGPEATKRRTFLLTEIRNLEVRHEA